MRGDTVAKKVSTDELPEGKSWHDLARPVVPYLLLAKELRESIGEQLTEADGDTRPEAWVNLDVPLGIREFYLDLIHHTAYSPEDGDFEASRTEFLSRFEGLDELLLMLGRWDEDPDYEAPDDEEEDEHPYNLSVYAGEEWVRTFPLLGFGDLWDFEVPIWFFHRAGVDLQTAYQTALDIDPSMEEMLFGDGEDPSVALVFTTWFEVYVYEGGELVDTIDISDQAEKFVRSLLEPYTDGGDTTYYELSEDFTENVLPDTLQEIPQELLRECSGLPI
jgi:hypothetical protein